MPENETFDTSQILGKPFGRLFEMHGQRALSVDKETRVVKDVSLASEEPIYHWFGYIILDHSATSIRLDRMKASGAALWCHNRQDHVGRWTDFTISESRKLTANTKFSRSPLGEEKFNDVLEEILCTTSVGFSMYELTPEIDPNNSDRQMYINDVPVFRSYDWEPFEASWEPIPADIGAGTNRSFEDLVTEGQKRSTPETLLQSATERNSTNEDNNTMPEEIVNQPAPAAPAPDTAVVEQRSAALNVAREIAEWGETLGASDFARNYIATNDTLSVDAFRAALREAQPASTAVPPNDAAVIAARQGAGPNTATTQLAVSASRAGVITAFDRGNKQENLEAAYRFGSFMLATVLRTRGDFSRSAQFCKDNGILNAEMIRALSEGVNSKGGFLVPVEFGNDLIDLRLKYGVFRRNAHVVQMSSDTRTDPRRVSGLTTNFVNESQLIPESDMLWDRVTLVAKKLAAYAVMSSELDEDAVIDIGNTLAEEIAYAFAKKEDECGFIGDGTSTYGGIVGILPTLRALDATIGNVAGIQVGTTGSGTAFSSFTITDFLGAMGLMPDYVDTSGDNAKWYVNKAFYFNVMAKLMLAGGGVTAAEIEDRRQQRFLGYPVEFVNVLNKTVGASVAVGLFGDLSKAATMGVRRDTTISESEHVRFQYDDIVIKGTERFDINVHSVGNGTAVAADRQPGPMVALYTAAS